MAVLTSSELLLLALTPTIKRVFRSTNVITKDWES